MSEVDTKPGYPAITNTGEEVRVIEKHVEAGAEVFEAEGKRFFTRNIIGDVHQLVEVIVEDEEAALSDIFAKARTIFEKEVPAATEIAKDVEATVIGEDEVTATPQDDEPVEPVTPPVAEDSKDTPAAA